MGSAFCDQPKLTVILPTYNRQRLTEIALASIISQGVANLEVVVVDDGSAPAFRIPDIVGDRRVRVIRHAVNRGAAAARNTGIAAARGSWLAFLDSDDRFVAGTLQARLQFAEEHNRRFGDRPTVYGCGFTHVNASREALHTRIPRPASTPEEFASGCWFSPGSAILMRRDVAKMIGVQDVSLMRLEDYDWFLRFSLLGGRLEIQNIIGAEIMSGRRPSRDVVRSAARALFGKWSTEARLGVAAFRRLQAYLSFEEGVADARHGSPISAIKHMSLSFLLVPRRGVRLCAYWAPQ